MTKRAPPAGLDRFGECPNCKMNWNYTANGGERYSHLIGIVSQEADALVAWECPQCKTRWKRDEVGR